MRGLSHNDLPCSVDLPSEGVPQPILSIYQMKPLLLPFKSSPPWGTSSTPSFHWPHGKGLGRRTGGTRAEVLVWVDQGQEGLASARHSYPSAVLGIASSQAWLGPVPGIP